MARENAGLDPTQPVHTVAEELLMIEDYVTRARKAWMGAPREDEVRITTEILRKIAAIAVRTMENHGVQFRDKKGQKAGMYDPFDNTSYV